METKPVLDTPDQTRKLIHVMNDYAAGGNDAIEKAITSMKNHYFFARESSAKSTRALADITGVDYASFEDVLPPLQFNDLIQDTQHMNIEETMRQLSYFSCHEHGVFVSRWRVGIGHVLTLLVKIKKIPLQGDLEQLDSIALAEVRGKMETALVDRMRDLQRVVYERLLVIHTNLDREINSLKIAVTAVNKTVNGKEPSWIVMTAHQKKDWLKAEFGKLNPKVDLARYVISLMDFNILLRLETCTELFKEWETFSETVKELQDAVGTPVDPSAFKRGLPTA